MELPLARHDLGVDAGDVDAGVQAGFIVSLDDVAAEDLARADATVVGALGAGEAALGPAVDVVVLVKQRVLLLEAEPGLVLGMGLHQPSGVVPVVELVGRAVVVPAFGHDQDIGAATEGIRVHSDRADVDVGVVAASLTRGRAVKIPLGQIFDALGRTLERLHQSVDGWISTGKGAPTLVLDRTPLVLSIQMYSAMTLPFWSSFMYFMSCNGVSLDATDAERMAHILRVRDGLALSLLLHQSCP